MNFHQSPSSSNSSHQSTPKNLRKHNHGICPSMEIEETPGLHEPFETSESWCQALSWYPGRSQAWNEMMYQNDRQWSTLPLAFRLSRAASSCPSRQTPVLNLQRLNSHIAITKDNWYSKQVCSSPAWCLCSCGDSRGGRRCVTHRSAHRCSWTIGRHDLRTVLPFTTLEDTIMAYVVTFSFKATTSVVLHLSTAFQKLEVPRSTIPKVKANAFQPSNFISSLERPVLASKSGLACTAIIPN